MNQQKKQASKTPPSESRSFRPKGTRNHDPEAYEALLASYGKTALVPEKVKSAAAAAGSYTARKSVQTAKALLTVASAAGWVGVRSLKKGAEVLKGRHKLGEEALNRALFVSPAKQALLRCEVNDLVRKASERLPGAPPETHASMACAALVRKLKISSGALGGLASVPGVLPGVGAAGTLVLKTSSDLVYMIRIQFLICLGTAMAYGVEMEAERFRAVALTLMEDLSSRESRKGVEGRFCDTIDRTANQYLKMGLKKAAETFLTRAGASRGISRMIPFVGVPFGVAANVNAVSALGRRAEMYFRNYQKLERGLE